MSLIEIFITGDPIFIGIEPQIAVLIPVASPTCIIPGTGGPILDFMTGPPIQTTGIIPGL